MQSRGLLNANWMVLRVIYAVTEAVQRGGGRHLRRATRWRGTRGSRGWCHGWGVRAAACLPLAMRPLHKPTRAVWPHMRESALVVPFIPLVFIFSLWAGQNPLQLTVKAHIICSFVLFFLQQLIRWLWMCTGMGGCLHTAHMTAAGKCSLGGEKSVHVGSNYFSCFSLLLITVITFLNKRPLKPEVKGFGLFFLNPFKTFKNYEVQSLREENTYIK